NEQAVMVTDTIDVTRGADSGQERRMILRAVEGAAAGQFEPVELLGGAERAADRRIDRITGKPGLYVRAAGIVCGDAQTCFAVDPGIVADVKTPIDLAGEIRPVEIGGDRRGDRLDAVAARRRRAEAVAV